MYYEVYIDQLFLENFLIMVLLLKLCAGLLGKTVSWKRICLSSILGAATTCAVIFFRTCTGNVKMAAQAQAEAVLWLRILFIILHWLAGVITPLFLAVFVGLRCRTIPEVLKSAMFLLGTTAAFGGFFQVIFTIWEPPVLLAATLAFMAINVLVRKQKRTAALGECRVTVILEDQGRRWELTGLIDTGNHLTEPLTGQPVSILEREEAEKIPRCRKALRDEEGYLYIPFSSVGTQRGWMRGVRVDTMRIFAGKKEVCITDPLLAVSENKLCGDGSYGIILHPMHVFPDGNS